MTIEQLTQLIGEQTKEVLRNRAALSYNHQTDLKAWEEAIGSRIGAKAIPGPKYTKIDVLTPQQSGHLMVVNETGEIFGIKAYGVIHKGHAYGTLETVDQYYWGEYTPMKIK